ncbi:MAG: DUF262 domain-containing HNH endonuclease family protein [Pseudomonadota bacterium]
MTRHLRARERAVGEVLNPERRLYAPSFQRFYEWTSEEALDLLDDIRGAQAASAHRHDDTPPYFLGCIVLVHDVGDDAAMIVDGQQRLTTLTIILAVLRDLALAAAEGEDGAEAAERLGAAVLAPSGAPAQPRDAILRARSLDKRFFYERIQRPGATQALDEDTAVETDAQAHLLDVALTMRDALQEISAPARVWLAETILRRCFLVEVVAPYEDQAYQVFTVLNARGKSLKPSGLLKAELLGKVPAARHVEFCDAWEALEADLGEENFVQLFSHLRMIEKPGKASKGVVTELRQALNPAAAPEAFLRRHLEPKGRIYQDLLASSLSAGAQTEPLRPILQSLNRLPNRDWAPPAIAYLAERAPGPEATRAFLTALERLAYAMFIQGGGEMQRMKRYRNLIEKIREGADLDDLIVQMRLTRNDIRTAQAVLNGAIYQKERVRGPVMLRIDQHLTDAVARYDIGEVSVEHVLPRKPADDSDWGDIWRPAERREWIDRLGNLCLLSKRINSAAANASFPRKKEVYFDNLSMTPFVITTQVLRETEWTPAVVRARHQALFEAACDIWDLKPLPETRAGGRAPSDRAVAG